jgi:hypothetical protein
MGRLDNKHSKEARAAVVYAVIEQQMTSAQVVALAAAGELKHNGRRLPAFRIAPSTVRNYTYLHRSDRPPQTSENETPAAETGPVEDPKEPTLLDRLVDEATEYEDALAKGLECECAEPDPSVYLMPWRPHDEPGPQTRVCHSCYRPTAAKRVDHR